METDENFKKSCELWVKGQENLIEQIKVNITNSENMVKLHSKALKLQKDTLAHEIQYLEQFKTTF
jgi:hypothetical protein